MDTGTAPTLRLFTALWPSSALRTALVSLRDRWQLPSGAAPVDDARLHVTLHFIGQVPAQRVPDLADALDLPMQPAELLLDPARQQVWPGGIAVLEFDAPDPLRGLHARLAKALAQLGLATEDRPWRPHVTLARKARGAIPARDADPLPPWQVDSYALVRSVPARGYDTLRRYAGAQG